jgi:hypothetical protein
MSKSIEIKPLPEIKEGKYYIGYDPIINDRKQTGEAAFCVCRRDSNSDIHFEYIGKLHALGSRLSEQLDSKIEKIAEYFGNCYIMKEEK